MLRQGLDLPDRLSTWPAAIDLGHTGLLLIAPMFLMWGPAAVVWRSGHRFSEGLA